MNMKNKPSLNLKCLFLLTWVSKVFFYLNHKIYEFIIFLLMMWMTYRKIMWCRLKTLKKKVTPKNYGIFIILWIRRKKEIGMTSTSEQIRNICDIFLLSKKNFYSFLGQRKRSSHFYSEKIKNLKTHAMKRRIFEKLNVQNKWNWNLNPWL